MGHPTRLFSSPPAEGFVCIICFDVLEDAVCTKECGHTFCEGCITQALNVNDASSCPNCRVVVTGTNPNYNLRDVIELMAVKCPREECDWTGLVRDMVTHDGVCSFKSVACTVVGCNHECKRKDMEEHNTSTQGIVAHMDLRYEQKMRDMEQKHEDKVLAMEQKLVATEQKFKDKVVATEQKFERKMEKKVKELESNMRLETNHMRYVSLCRGWIEHKRSDSGRMDDFGVFKIKRGNPITGLLCKIMAHGVAYPMFVRYESAYAPPTCKFPRGFFHLNVCPDGSLRSKDFGWMAETALSEILLNVQQILLHPRPSLIRQKKAGDLHGMFGTPAYNARAKKETEKYPHKYRDKIYNHPKARDMLEEGEAVWMGFDFIEDTWISCATCKKWRMMPPDMPEEEIQAIPDTWYCKDNRFDPARSTCEAEERSAIWMAAYYERRATIDED